jgi:hypothetical protein
MKKKKIKKLNNLFNNKNNLFLREKIEVVKMNSRRKKKLKSY